jgi:antitoxin component YwqK of YwqJK toxin-antitoxin module
MQDKKPMNDNEELHGNYETYHLNGQLRYKGLYLNGYRLGFHESYWSDGTLNFKGNFINNEYYGYLESHWHDKIIKDYYAK